MKDESGEMKEKYYRAEAFISAEALAEGELRGKFPLRNGDFLIASKMRSIRFRKFAAQIPTMIHRAVLAPPFWRQKVAETNV